MGYDGALTSGHLQAWSNASVVPISGCSGCATTAGRLACPHHGPQAHRQESDIKITHFACLGSPTHDFAVGDHAAVCNRCEKVVEW